MIVKTGKNTRISYAYLMTPNPKDDSPTPRYSVSLIISKDDEDNLNKIKEAIQGVYDENYPIFRGKPLPKTGNPLRDGDKQKPDDPAYKNSYFISAKSKNPPKVVDKYNHPIEDPAEIYSGCYGIAAISFYPYDVSGNKGIGCGIQGFMKFNDGERLGGSSAESLFAEDAEDADFDFIG